MYKYVHKYPKNYFPNEELNQENPLIFHRSK